MTGLVVTDVDRLGAIRITGGVIAAVGPDVVPTAGDETIDANGGAVLPGLHDHHLHLLAMAAERASVRCGPPDVTDKAGLVAALVAAPGTGWVRGVGYHESVAGDLDRQRLDELVAHRPVRIQHDSGALWMLNSTALAQIGLPDSDGRLFRLDAALRERWAADRRPDLAPVGETLASFGVTGVTDATPGMTVADAGQLRSVPQRVFALGVDGPHKIVLGDHALPTFAALTAEIDANQPVAIHAVTRQSLALAVAALAEVGSVPGDRIEHASVAPPDLVVALVRLGVRVVTQPNFRVERADRYARDVEADDRPWLYRCRGFATAGVPLAAGTDAPFGRPDPWAAMRAAVDHDPAERLTPEEALGLFLSPPDDPGGAARRVERGAPADLVVLAVPWADARRTLSADLVGATVIGGVRYR